MSLYENRRDHVTMMHLYDARKISELYDVIFARVLEGLVKDQSSVCLPQLKVQRSNSEYRVVELSTRFLIKNVSDLVSGDPLVQGFLMLKSEIFTIINAEVRGGSILKYRIRIHPNFEDKRGKIVEDLKFFAPQLLYSFDSRGDEGYKHVSVLFASYDLSGKIVTPMTLEHSNILEKIILDLKDAHGEPLPSESPHCHGKERFCGDRDKCLG